MGGLVRALRSSKLDKVGLKIAEAELRVREMDKTDSLEDRYLPTILEALLCGLNRPDTDAQYDAAFMLGDLIDLLRQGYSLALIPGHKAVKSVKE